MHTPERAFLIRVAELLHRYGTPAHRLERVLQKLAGRLRVEAAFLSTPTSLTISFGRGAAETTHLLRVDSGETDLGKLIEFDEVMEDVEDGRSDVSAALVELERVAAAPPRYPLWLRALAFALASAAAARFFGGGAREVALSALLGPGILGLSLLAGKRSSAVGLVEPLAAFLVAALALLVARLLLPLDDRIVTLSGLIVLLPGLTLTVALTELATRHLVSGTARMAGAATTFLSLLFGVALAWRMGDLFVPAPGLPAGALELPGWSEWIALCIAPLAFAVILEARTREVGVILATGVAGYLAARYGSLALGNDLGAFLGALVVGVASNLYARALDRPALVPSTPGILLLVPGSLGFRSLTSFLVRDSVQGMEWAFQTGLVAVSLVGGLLFANLLLPPRRVL